jgi:hypothetical protein
MKSVSELPPIPFILSRAPEMTGRQNLSAPESPLTVSPYLPVPPAQKLLTSTVKVPLLAAGTLILKHTLSDFVNQAYDFTPARAAPAKAVT